MDKEFYGGLLFCGYATFQLLGFLSKAFPSTTGGAIALIILGLLLIVISGINNWLGLYYKHHGIVNKIQNIVGFAPIYILGSLALFAVMVGIYVAF
jgi:hypothetical protein